MKSFPITGVVAATHSPFLSDGSLHCRIIERQAEFLISQGVSYAFVGGTTGESHSLSMEERLELVEYWIAATRGSPLRVIVHAGANSLGDAEMLASQASKLGAAAVSAIPPCYFKPRTLEALVECSARVAAAAPDVPFFYYDIPSMTGVAFPMGEYLEKAAERIPNLAGLKFSNHDLAMFQQCLVACGGKLTITFGCDEFLLASLVLGGRGGIGSTYNFAAPLYHRLMAAFEQGRLDDARKEQRRSVSLVALLSSFGYMAASKALMGMLGVEVGPPRLPHAALSPEATQSLRQQLEELGFFEWIAGKTLR